MKTTTALLLALGLTAAGPALADSPAAPTSEAQTDIEVINGVPVNPQLKARIMESEQPLSVQELIELSNEVLAQQQAALAEAGKAGDDQAWMQDDPLGTLEGEMQELVLNIQESDTAEQTQARGEEVVRKMDTLIALMEKACSACSSAAGGQGQGQGQQDGQANGGKPANDSTLAAGPGGSGDLNDAGNGNNRFEDLDPAQRDAILRAQSDNQGLPGDYDALLAEYFQRLASEEALDSAESEPAGDE